jgi:hypothetical protein
VPARIPEGKTSTLLCHEQDRDLWYDLMAHFTLLRVRLERVAKGAFVWKSFYYPTTRAVEPNEYETFVQALQEGVVFVPGTSASLLLRFWQHGERDPRIGEALARQYVQPIPLRAASGVRQSIIAQPLAAYARGPEREEACVQIVEAIEQKLLRHLAQRKVSLAQPSVLLEEITTLSALPAPQTPQETPERVKAG